MGQRLHKREMRGFFAALRMTANNCLPVIHSQQLFVCHLLPISPRTANIFLPVILSRMAKNPRISLAAAIDFTWAHARTQVLRLHPREHVSSTLRRSNERPDGSRAAAQDCQGPQLLHGALWYQPPGLLRTLPVHPRCNSTGDRDQGLASREEDCADCGTQPNLARPERRLGQT